MKTIKCHSCSKTFSGEGLDPNSCYCPHCCVYGCHAEVEVASPIATLSHEDQLIYARDRQEESNATHRVQEESARRISAEEVRRYKEDGVLPVSHACKLSDAITKEQKATESAMKAAKDVKHEENRASSIRFDHEHRMAKLPGDLKMAEIREMNESERRMKQFDHNHDTLQEHNRIEELKLKLELEKVKVERQAESAQKWKAFHDSVTAVVGPGAIIILFRQAGFVAATYIVSQVIAEALKTL